MSKQDKHFDKGFHDYFELDVFKIWCSSTAQVVLDKN